MGLFDHIINDQASTAAVANPPVQGTGTSGQDDAILIIDDTPAVSTEASSFAMFAPEKAEVITNTPMTAEDLIMFDESPVAEVASPAISSIVAEELVATPLEIKDETSELSTLLAQANEESEKQAPSFFAQETVTVPAAEVKIPEISLQDEVFATSVATPIVAPVVEKIQEAKPLEDPNAVLDSAITQLEAGNANRDLVRQGKEREIEAKNQTIAELNKQVATLKKEITGINKEIDKIDSDKARVNDMIKLFQSQKAA